MPSPGIKRLGHVCLGSRDLGKTLAFYRDILGCTIVHEFKTPEDWTYGLFLLVNNDTFLEFFHQQDRQQEGGLFRHMCFEVEDIHAFAGAMAQKGFSPEVIRGRTDGVLQFWVNDPDGNKVEFHQYDEQSVQFSCLKDPTRDGPIRSRSDNRTKDNHGS